MHGADRVGARRLGTCAHAFVLMHTAISDNIYPVRMTRFDVRAPAIQTRLRQLVLVMMLRRQIQAAAQLDRAVAIRK